jgi:hypothetical protein
MSLVFRSPFFGPEVRGLLRLFDEPFVYHARQPAASALGRFFAEGALARPAVDLTEQADAYKLVAELPGYRCVA